MEKTIFVLQQPSNDTIYTFHFMRILPLLALFILFSSLSTYAQVIQRNPNESAEAFAKRIFKTDELAHPVIETKEWDSTKKVIICFVDFTTDAGDGILGYLLIPAGINSYKKTLIDTFWQGGGSLDPKIESVLFANADKDKPRELIVMTSAKSHPPRFADSILKDTIMRIISMTTRI